jgi:hypothetical protein
MKNFIYNIEKNKYMWFSKDIKLVFSDPSIQAHDDYSLVESIKDILYYYYTVEIYKKVYHKWDEDNDKAIYKWSLVAKRNTHDWPCIEQLLDILEYIKDLDIITNGEKHEYRSGNVKYSKHFHTEGFACDDFYEITKYVNEKGKTDGYVVYIGCTFDSEGDLNSVGIRTPYINQKDIDALYKCVKGFVDYSIKRHNEIISLRNKLESENKEEIEGKLYQYVIENDYVNKQKVESIYVVGDKIDVTYLVEENNKVISKEKSIEIKEVNKNYIISTQDEQINIYNIVFIMDNVPDEKKYYNIDKVTSDFISIMTEYEINDFKNLNEEELFIKYNSVIIDRTCMCWDDTHNFPILVSKDELNWNIKNAKAVVKVIITNIKNHFTKNMEVN